MPKNRHATIIHIVVLASLTLFFVVYINLSYPFVGHDYSSIMPRLLDTYLHYKVNGLSIQWYTPSFGGGLPAYPNPLHMQFSLPQLLTPLLNPWIASLASTIIFLTIGYFAAYRFLTHVLLLRWQAGILGALFFIANGFYVERMAVGHVCFQTFPLLPVILLALFSASLSPIVSAIIIALVVTTVFHQLGYYLIVIFVLSLAIVLPLLYLYAPRIFDFKRLAVIFVLGLLFLFLLSGSKIYAMHAVTRYFPRSISEQFSVTFFQGLLGMFRQFLGTMNLIPLRLLKGQDINALPLYFQITTGSNFGMWEIDSSLTPVLLIFLLVGIPFLFSPKTNKTSRPARSTGRWVAWFLLFFATWLAIEFTLAKGFIYPLLHRLPILESLHVNPRFASALILPLALLGAFSCEKVFSRWKFLTKPLIFSTLTILTLAPLAFYFTFTEDTSMRAFNLDSTMRAFELIRSGDILPVERVALSSDSTALVEYSSSLRAYDNLFEDAIPQVHVGPVDEIQDGYYNMTNPASLVYPEENNVSLFERIPATDTERLEDFVNRRQPDWERPVTQTILDGTALVSLIAFTIVLGWSTINQLFPNLAFLPRRFRRNPDP